MGDLKSCQLHVLSEISLGKADDYCPSLKKRIIRAVSIHLSPRFKMQLKMLLFEPKRWFRKFIFKQKRGKTSIPSTVKDNNPLKIGEMVRVRSSEEIMTSLDRWGQLNGCSFISEMNQYCGTTQEVFKLVHRFVDERDRNVKRTRGVVLLKNVFCQGTTAFGACDRSCLYFWREEWLEKI